MIDRKPAVVVRCQGVADVITAVQFAREHGLLLCIKGGGHNIAGLATADGALMLDMSLMRGIWVDAERGIAHAQTGCLLGDVDCETQVRGLASVLGFVSQTGIAGLTHVPDQPQYCACKRVTGVIGEPGYDDAVGPVQESFILSDRPGEMITGC